MSNSVLTNGKKSLNGMKRILLLVGMAVAAALPAQAADYVFMYDGGYLAVNNSGAVVSTTTFSRSCVWTCVSNTTSLAAATLGTTSRWLYTEVNGTRYWLVGSTTNGTAVTVTTTAPGTAYWRNDGDNLYYYSSNNYYLYYRGSSWRTSRSSSTTWNNRNNNNYYEGYYGDYRSTTTQVATASVAQTAIGGTVTAPVITPSAEQTLAYGGSASYATSATGTQTVAPAHTTYTFNGTTYCYYNNTVYINAADFAVNSSVTPTYTWELSGDGASALELMATSGENTIVKYTGSASGTTATLTVTAKAGTETRTASVTINVTPVEPTAISATDATVYVGNSGEVVYTLTPNYAYNRVAAVSGDAGVFTVSSPATGGAVAVTPVAPGQATLTLTALNSDGTNGPSTTATVTVRDRCAAPQFSFSQSGSSVLATLTCATLGATIRYTTDGTDPTPTTGNVYSVPFASANGQVIKAIAVLGDYYDASAVATKTVSPIDYVAQGVSGGIVTLNDLEDHSWSYYGAKPDTDYPDQLLSPNPRNVKIIYDGNGGEVSYNENASQFVYYKTIENVGGAYTYKVIPNPFSKRPTVGTGDTRWRGFGGWKIISGGEYISGHNNGDVLDLEETLTLTGLDAGYTTNCISATIELQATWVQAYVSTVSSGNITSRPAALSGSTYETNFIVITDNGNHTVSGTGRVTISNRYPDGSAGGTGTVNGCTSAADGTKVEFANIAGTFTAAAGPLMVGRGCTGTVSEVTGTNATRIKDIRLESGTYSFVHPMQGLGDNADNRGNFVFGCDYDRANVSNSQPYGDNSKLRIVVFTALNGAGGHANNNTNDLLNIVVKSGYYGFTSDFAYWQTNKNDGWGLGIGGNTDNFGDNYVVPDETGTMRTYTYGTKPPQNTMSFYVGPTRGGGKGGKNYLRIEGGELSSVNGGGTTNPEDFIRFDMRMTGGWVKGAIYGGASATDCSGSSKIVITGGEVNSWIGGGCNGTDINAGAGATSGTIYIYAGGDAQIRSHNSDGVYNNAWGLVNHIEGGQIYGGGRGMGSAGSYSGSATRAFVVVADDSYVEQNVYGGSCHGVSQNGYVYILGGTVGKDVFGGSFQPTSTNATWQAKNTYVRMYNGLVKGGIYGGNDESGTVTENAEVLILGGQVGTTTQPANIHGGGYGQATRVLGSVNVTLGKDDCSSVLDGVTVYGDVYGGSAEGRTNGNTGRNGSAVTNVTLYHGTINGALYGGGLGTSTYPAYVYGPVAVKVYGGSVRTNDGSGENGSGGVFGCNNVNGTPQSTVTVDIYGTDPAPDANSFALFAVYGGGNRSDYTGVPVVTVHGCNNSIEYVYGGGNASAVAGTNVTIWGGHIGNAFGGGNGYSVTGNHDVASAPHYNPGANITASGANLTIHGGTIDAAFGGSNQWGYINGGITVAVAEQDEPGSNPCTDAAYGSCSNLIVELYGGGNQAPAVTSGDVYISPNVTISSCDMKITNLFGGAKNANHGANINLVVEKGQFENVFGGNNLGGTITGNITLTLKGGTMVNAFGGNNQGGSITGTITVLVDSTGTECPLKVDNVYGGGNEAAYSPNVATAATPTVNFVNGTVRNAVFGGGLGSAAKITANPTVNIGGTGSKHAIVGGMRVDGVTPGVGNVYGGGSQADVLKDGDNTGNTSVTLSGNAVVKGNVYGGGNEANVEGNSSVKLEE